MAGLRIETEPVTEAIAELERILGALPGHHGDAYRALERAIEALADPPQPQPVLRTLTGEDGVAMLVMTPPPEFTALIREAKRLGV